MTLIAVLQSIMYNLIKKNKMIENKKLTIADLKETIYLEMMDFINFVVEDMVEFGDDLDIIYNDKGEALAICHLFDEMLDTMWYSMEACFDECYGVDLRCWLDENNITNETLIDMIHNELERQVSDSDELEFYQDGYLSVVGLKVDYLIKCVA